MAFQTILMKFRRAMLCCSRRDRKAPMHIGSPTDVRRVDVSDALPGLTDAERRYIREKASSDAIHLLGLQSHPPSAPASQPPTTPPSPTSSNPSTLGNPSRLSSREPSMALLNAASKDLPTSLPDPPPQKHSENSPPAARMRGMRDSLRRTSTSNSSFGSEGVEEMEKELERMTGEQHEQKGTNGSFLSLNLDFEYKDKKGLTDSPQTLSFTDEFELQDTTGGHIQVPSPTTRKVSPTPRSLIVQRAAEATVLDDSSDSDDDVSTVNAEHKPFVKI